MATPLGEGIGRIDGGTPLPPVEALHNAPEVDPVAAALNGHTEIIPRAGYLVSAVVRPGYPNGTFEVKRYGENGLQLDLSGAKQRQGNSAGEEGSVPAHIVGSADMRVAVENRFPRDMENDNTHYGEIPLQKATVYPLSTTGKNATLFVRKAVFAYGADSSTFTILTSHYNNIGNYFYLQRAVADLAGLPGVFGALAQGMALSAKDRATLVATSMAKAHELKLQRSHSEPSAHGSEDSTHPRWWSRALQKLGALGLRRE